MADAGLIGGLAQALLDVLDPLRRALASPEAFESILRREGWQPPPVRTYFAAVSDALKLDGNLEGAATAIESLLDGDSTNAEQLAAAVGALVKVISDLRAIAKTTDNLPPPFDSAEFWSAFPADLIADLFLSYLELAKPTMFAPLHLLGILDEEEKDGAGEPGRVAFVQRKVKWDRLVTMVSDPASLARDVYGWGGTFDHDKLLRRLERVLLAFGVPAGRHIPRQSFAAQYYGGAAPPEAVRELRVPLLEDHFSDIGFVRAGLLALPIPPAGSPNAAPVGFFAGPYAYGQAGARIELGGPFALTLKGGLESGGDVGVEVRPDAVAAHLGSSGTDLDVEAALVMEPQTPFVLIGSEDSSRLQLGKSSLALSVAGPVASPELQLKLHFDSLSLVFDPSGGGGFLTELFGSDLKKAEASGELVWSSKSGLHFSGQADLKLAFPVQIPFGPITIQQVGVEIAAGGQGVALIVTVTGGADIGPIHAVASDVGVKLSLTPVTAPARGTFGDLDLSFGFKPPSGVGLGVDSAGVSGGGFLKHDEAKQEYSGMLQLQFADLALQAFGLITTQVAGGAGYSLLALVDAEFPPIALGWGFTLNGVGGLVAVHRTASVDALRAALKADQLSYILFPKNAITNAPQILSQLDVLFPAAPGRFLFGPMALIGWGTPTVLTAAIAVVLELPEPVRILLLARVAVRAPSESNPLVRINMDALGVLDLGNSELSFDATLCDSRLLNFTLSGDMALRARWSGQREFLLAIGGFHPRFTPPVGFPTLQRMAIDMPSGMVAKLRLAAYLALTSNTVQFGADLDVFIGVSEFGLSGHLGFDALLQLDPFYFESDISGKVALTAGGDDLMSVSLDAMLSGPAPWNIAGNFKVHIVFFDVHKSFSHSWGDDAPPQSVVAVDVGQLLGATLADPRSWDARLPDGVPALVALRAIDDPTAVLAHPLALPEVHERIVPLDLDITRFGQAAPAGATRFAITDWRLGGAAPPREAVQDDFAPAQFFDLSDDEKLARPSFERHDAGVKMRGGLVASGPAVTKTIAYETFFVDEPGGALRTDPGTPVRPLLLADALTTLGGGSAGRAPVARASYRRYTAPGNPIRVAEPRFVVVDGGNLAPVGIGPASGGTYSDVQALLAAEASRAPDRRAAIEIVATHEMVAS